MRAALLLALVPGCAFGFEGGRGDKRGLLEVGAFFGSGELIDDTPHVEAYGFRSRFQLIHGAHLGWGASLGYAAFTAAPEGGTASHAYRAGYLVPELVLQVVPRFTVHGGAGPTWGRLRDDGTDRSVSAFGGFAVLAADVVPYRARRSAFLLRLSTAHARSRRVEDQGLSASLVFLEGVFIFR
jgi:hypothetical protein